MACVPAVVGLQAEILSCGTRNVLLCGISVDLIVAVLRASPQTRESLTAVE